MNLPNKISIVRICLIPVFILFFFLEFTGHYFAAAAIFAIAAATDFLDGYIARSRNLVTNLGKFLDPIADKVLVATAFILLLTAKEAIFAPFGAAATAVYITVSICVCVILARELIISAFRQIAAAAGIVLAAEKLGKYKTLFQDVCIVALLAVGNCAGTAAQIVAYIGGGLFAIASVLTIISGVSYVVKNKQVLTSK